MRLQCSGHLFIDSKYNASLTPLYWSVATKEGALLHCGCLGAVMSLHGKVLTERRVLHLPPRHVSLHSVPPFGYQVHIRHSIRSQIIESGSGF